MEDKANDGCKLSLIARNDEAGRDVCARKHFSIEPMEWMGKMTSSVDHCAVQMSCVSCSWTLQLARSFYSRDAIKSNGPKTVICTAFLNSSNWAVIKNLTNYLLKRAFRSKLKLVIVIELVNICSNIFNLKKEKLKHPCCEYFIMLLFLFLCNINK